MGVLGLEGRRALVTGSTKHTGYAIAETLLRQGVSVAVNGRKKEDVRRAAAALNKEAAGNAAVVEAPGDISSPEDVQKIFAAVVERLGSLDILVNNACHQGLGYEFLDLPVDEWDAVIGVNLRGLFLCSQSAARLMVKQGGGVIVNIGSNTAQRAIRHRTAYITTKGGIDAATRSLALDLAPHNIRVNCILAGYIHTSRWDVLPAEILERRRSGIPLGLEAEGTDIANAVVFLASPGSRRITGASLVVDAGAGVQLLTASEEAAGSFLYTAKSDAAKRKRGR